MTAKQDQPSGQGAGAPVAIRNLPEFLAMGGTIGALDPKLGTQRNSNLLKTLESQTIAKMQDVNPNLAKMRGAGTSPQQAGQTMANVMAQLQRQYGNNPKVLAAAKAAAQNSPAWMALQQVSGAQNMPTTGAKGAPPAGWKIERVQ